MRHIPVMLKEVIHYLNPQFDKRYLDCTFGAGGYSQSILAAEAEVIAIDQDPTVNKIANKFKQEFGNKFHFIQNNFADIKNLLEPFGKVDGIIWDLGVSSMQLDDGERGFSFAKEAMLDMRMSQNGYSAFDFINTATEKDIADVIFYNGGEVKARQIAKSIIEARKLSTINTTTELANIVRRVINRHHTKIDPATKTFQAIRIFVNDELSVLAKSLEVASDLLNPEGIIIVVSFHSLEDKIIKDYLKRNAIKKVAKSKYAKDISVSEGIYKILTPKAITPSIEEVQSNPRARSAKLRAARKINTL